MTDAPARKIGGLTPRSGEPALRRLVKANREAAPASTATQPTSSPTETPTATPSTPQPAAAAAKAAPASKRARQAAAKPHRAAQASSGSKSTLTVYVPGDIRARSRAAFKATQRLEGDASYSDMVAKAIATEVARREAAYNEGRPFVGGDEALPTGRPLVD